MSYCAKCDKIFDNEDALASHDCLVPIVGMHFNTDAIKEGLSELSSKPINETHAQIKTAVAKRNEEEYKRIWNSAIEAAAIVCADVISRDAVRMLKK